MIAGAHLYLGGTFNPVHIGHLRLALECGAQMRPASFSFVPCSLPPHKAAPEVSVAQRLQMLDLAVTELNQVCLQGGYRVEMCELARTGPSYTEATLQTLRARHCQDAVAWVIGMDSLVNLDQWRNWRELTDWADLLVINRPGWQRPDSGPVAEWLTDKVCPRQNLRGHGSVAFLETTALAVSSTAIRAQMAAGLSGYYLLSEPVRRYIEEQELYQ